MLELLGGLELGPHVVGIYFFDDQQDFTTLEHGLDCFWEGEEGGVVFCTRKKDAVRPEGQRLRHECDDRAVFALGKLLLVGVVEVTAPIESDPG